MERELQNASLCRMGVVFVMSGWKMEAGESDPMRVDVQLEQLRDAVGICAV